MRTVTSSSHTTSTTTTTTSTGGAGMPMGHNPMMQQQMPNRMQNQMMRNPNAYGSGYGMVAQP